MQCGVCVTCWAYDWTIRRMINIDHRLFVCRIVANCRRQSETHYHAPADKAINWRVLQLQFVPLRPPHPPPQQVLTAAVYTLIMLLDRMCNAATKDHSATGSPPLFPPGCHSLAFFVPSHSVAIMAIESFGPNSAYMIYGRTNNKLRLRLKNSKTWSWLSFCQFLLFATPEKNKN